MANECGDTDGQCSPRLSGSGVFERFASVDVPTVDSSTKAADDIVCTGLGKVWADSTSGFMQNDGC